MISNNFQFIFKLIKYSYNLFIQQITNIYSNLNACRLLRLKTYNTNQWSPVFFFTILIEWKVWYKQGTNSNITVGVSAGLENEWTIEIYIL